MSKFLSQWPTDFDDLEIPGQEGGTSPVLHGRIQHFAIAAPIGSKDDDDRNLVGGSLLQCLFDFEFGVGGLILWIVRSGGSHR